MTIARGFSRELEGARWFLPLRLGALGALAFGSSFHPASAEEPSVSYIFPAGGQRGTTVNFRVGGHYLHGQAGFEMLGAGVTALPRVRETNTIWFEGPVIPLPASQASENYPRDHAGSVSIAKDAPEGTRYWRVWTSQGAAPAMRFLVGDLPEVTEVELDGEPIPVAVKTPVTINGRIFPREDVDVWTFPARAGQEFTCTVAAHSVGSPLQARLVATDADGRQLGEATATQRGDPRLHFKAASDGVCSVRIHDVGFAGLQHFVYRLTITSGPVVNSIFPLGARRGQAAQFELAGHALPARTAQMGVPADAARSFAATPAPAGRPANAVLLEVDDAPEYTHSPATATFTPPAMLNGRIAAPGGMNGWTFNAKKGEALDLTLAAPRLGSPLTPVLAVFDAQGRQLARAESAAGDTGDLALSFKPPADGEFGLRVSDRFASRGGPEFAYRLRVGPPPAPDFQIAFTNDALNVVRDLVDGPTPDPKNPRGKNKPGQLKLHIASIGSFAGEIELSVEGLPDHVTVTNTRVAAKKPVHDLAFNAGPQATIGARPITVRGTATINGQNITRTATFAARRGEPALDTVLLAVALPTPFKHYGEYLFALGPRGTVFNRHYQLDRGGFTGPITVRFADRQGRHLQGAAGRELVVPPEADRFVYPVTLPPWMEIGRTSRSQLMTSGVVKDHDGTEHVVSYSSNEQPDQVIVVISGGLLTVEAGRHSIPAAAGQSVEISVRVQRDPSISDAPVRVEAVLPAHVTGVTSHPVVLAAGQGEAMLKFTLGAQAGPFPAAAVLRATTVAPAAPHFAEARIELVPPAATRE
ncbi:MAG: hypothetical protein FJ386_11715 [Verrucomicrobia bacterium]|nr:hypothetical protein [Verrucomicrobiota bacterium]